MDTHVTVSDLATSNEVWRAIKTIANTSSRNDKIKLLEEQKATSNSLFEYVLKLVFDNTINFGVKIGRDEQLALMSPPEDGDVFDTAVSHFLTLLASGTYTRKEALAELSRLTDGMSYESRLLLISIINRDIGAGINASTINKVFKGLIPTFPYMRCSLLTQVDLKLMNWKLGVYAQEKADGMFVNINTCADGIHLLSRQGTPIPTTSPEFEDLARVLPTGYQIHGEMLVVDPNGREAPREIGNGLINSYIKSGTLLKDGWTFTFKVWDKIPLNAVQPKGKYTEAYGLRFQELRDYIKRAVLSQWQIEKRHIRVVDTIETRIVHSPKEAMAFYRYMLSCGKEGAVLKESTAIWRDGTSKEQIKLKLECDCDLQITGFDEGEGKFSDNLGSIVCQSSDGELIVNVSGFNDKTRRMIWDNREKYLNTIVTVKFNSVLKKEGSPASLFLPRFVEFRTDKTEADSLSRIFETQNREIGL